jgi:hypothetical protein
MRDRNMTKKETYLHGFLGMSSVQTPLNQRVVLVINPPLRATGPSGIGKSRLHPFRVMFDEMAFRAHVHDPFSAQLFRQRSVELLVRSFESQGGWVDLLDVLLGYQIVEFRL